MHGGVQRAGVGSHPQSGSGLGHVSGRCVLFCIQVWGNQKEQVVRLHIIHAFLF